MEEKLTIKKIAELSGVSVATVSRVINQNGRFSAETEARVKQVIEENRYIPNVVAKGLRTNHTKVVGVIVPDILNYHFASLVLEIEKELFAHSYSTVICNTNESAKLEQKHIDTLVAQQVSGIIIISGTQYYKTNASIPIIYADRRPINPSDDKNTIIIESDNEAGGYQATMKLIENGCKEVAILQALRTDYNQKARNDGYRRALKEAGREFKEEYVINLDEVSIDAAKEMMIKLGENGIRFDGLICNTDDLAIGAMMGLKECGLKIPEDVMVTGFDDTVLASVYEPKLSSVHQFVNKMAEQATDLMLDLINQNSIEKKHIVIPVQFVERESTMQR
jgi:LacI family transcriptional regulator